MILGGVRTVNIAWLANDEITFLVHAILIRKTSFQDNSQLKAFMVMIRRSPTSFDSMQCEFER